MAGVVAGVGAGAGSVGAGRVVAAVSSSSLPHAASTAAPRIVAPPSLNRLRRLGDGTPRIAAFSSVVSFSSPPMMRVERLAPAGHRRPCWRGRCAQLAADLVGGKVVCSSSVVLVVMVWSGREDGGVEAGERIGAVAEGGRLEGAGREHVVDRLAEGEAEHDRCWASIGRIVAVAAE